MKLSRHKQFINDFKKVKLANSQFEKMIVYFNIFLEDKKLPSESKDHELKGEYKGFRELHLGGDLLVIYYTKDNEIVLARLGTHSQLFK
ncbi:MAG: type II toxin-antitoxin system YafQ family toxin [Campylobacterota bacterium]|nr:type II toxin-antitoxin system YafQ family toxin [Campylobacterota bacterium]